MTTIHSRPNCLRWAITAAAIVTMLLTACTSASDVDKEPTMDTRQAAYRIEAHIEEVISQLPDAARLTEPYKQDALPCDAPDDGGPEGRVIVEHDYVIDGLPSDSFAQHFETVQQHWEDRGYRKLRFERDEPYLEMVYTDSDGFRLRLATSADGSQLSIRSQSPCIWPNGRPEAG